MKRGRSVRRTHKYDIVNRDPPPAWCVERNGAAPFSKGYPLPPPSPPTPSPFANHTPRDVPSLVADLNSESTAFARDLGPFSPGVEGPQPLLPPPCMLPSPGCDATPKEVEENGDIGAHARVREPPPFGEGARDHHMQSSVPGGNVVRVVVRSDILFVRGVPGVPLEAGRKASLRG